MFLSELLNERLGLFRGRQLAGQVQIGAADKHRVGAEDRFDTQRLQLRKHDFIDPVRRLRRIGTLHKACHLPGGDQPVQLGLGLLGQGALVVGDLHGSRIRRPGLVCFHLQRSGRGFRRLGCLFVRQVCLFGSGDPLLEVRQGLFGRLLPRFGLGQLLRGAVGLNRRLLQLLLHRGQSCLGRIGRFALGGGIGGGLLACRIELDEFLGRFLGRLVRGRGGGHLVLGGGQGRVGGLLLRRRCGQLLRGGWPGPELVARLAALGPGRPRHRQPLCVWRPLGLPPASFPLRPSRNPAAAFSAAAEAVVAAATWFLTLAKAASASFFCAVARASFCAAASARFCGFCWAACAWARAALAASAALRLAAASAAACFFSPRQPPWLGLGASRLLGCRRSRRGGGDLVLDAGQGRVGRFLLRLALRPASAGRRLA